MSGKSTDKKEPMLKSKPITIHTERVNSYGYYVLTGGIQMGEFKNNPVMYWNHNRWSREEIAVVGRWEDLKVQAGGKVVATPVIDDGDRLGGSLKHKYDNNFIRAASIGIEVLGVDRNPNNWKRGQTRPTVIKSRLIEVSLVDIPANKDAVQLYVANDEGGYNRLDLSEDNGVAQLNEILPINNNKEPKMDFIKLKAAINGLPDITLSEDVTVDNLIAELEAAAAKLKADAEALKAKDIVPPSGDTAELQERITELEAKLADSAKETAKAKAENLVNEAVLQNKISKSEADGYIKLALTDDGYAAVENLLKAKKGMPTTLTDLIKANKLGGDGKELSDADLYDKLASENKLAQLKEKDPDEFQRLQKAKIKSAKK